VPIAERFEIREAEAGDALAITEIHLAARSEAMPYLDRAHTDNETRDYFARVVGDPPGAWWVACCGRQIVGYTRIEADRLDHLYVRPGRQRRGIGSALLDRAKTLTPDRIELWTFQRNADARAFYAAHGFRPVAYTDGCNEEHEPDVKFAWTPAGCSG
jgi:GNAT superfamily N-acetyltransferase